MNKFEDDPYWMLYGNVVPLKKSQAKAENLPAVERTQKKGIRLTAKPPTPLRAPEPSPLLKDYMIEKGIPVK